MACSKPAKNDHDADDRPKPSRRTHRHAGHRAKHHKAAKRHHVRRRSTHRGSSRKC